MPLRELAAYRIGSDCGEDTPTDWTLEACDSCVHSNEETWETLDVRTAEPWRSGCEGEWRDYSIQRWRVLRISSGVQDWCLDALRLNGEENKPLRINSARPVAAPGATEASGARDFAQRASTISRLVGIGGRPRTTSRGADTTVWKSAVSAAGVTMGAFRWRGASMA